MKRIPPRRWAIALMSFAAMPLAWAALRPAMGAVANQQLLKFGAQLIAHAPVEAQARKLVINGQKVTAVTQTQGKRLEQLLAEKASACAQDVFVSERVGAEAFAMCLRVHPDVALWPTLLAAVDLAPQGSRVVKHIAYTYFVARPSGVAVIDVFANDVNPFAFVTPPDDAKHVAADDVAALPRPQGARLGFSLLEEGQPYGFTVFTHGELDPARNLADLQQRLRARGFTVKAAATEGIATSDGQRLWMSRDDLWGVLTTFEDAQGTVTAFAVSAGDAPAAAQRGDTK